MIKKTRNPLFLMSHASAKRVFSPRYEFTLPHGQFAIVHSDVGIWTLAADPIVGTYLNCVLDARRYFYLCDAVSMVGGP